MSRAYKIALLSSSGKYLTTDYDGNVSLDNAAKRLPKGQQWTLESSAPEGDGSLSSVYAIYSTNGHYLTVDKSGKVSVDAEEPKEEQRFEIDVGYCGSGGWLLRNVAQDMCLSSKNKKVLCKKQQMQKMDQKWYVRLVIHPHVCLFSEAKQCYGRVHAGRLAFDTTVPWQSNALFTLKYTEGYGYFQDAEGKYLSREGRMMRDCCPQCLFVLEVTGDRVRLKDYSGHYLSVNTRGRLLSTTGKDRATFDIKLSYPHVTFHQNVKGTWMKLFAKEGCSELVSIEASKCEDHEDETIFELSPLSLSTTPNSKWALTTADNRYLIVDTEGKLCVSKAATHTAKQFEFEFVGNAFVLRHSHTSQCVRIDDSGRPYLTANIINESTRLTLELVNRPRLILRGEYGYIKVEGSGKKNKVRCDSAEFDDLGLTYEPETNTYRVAVLGEITKYWSLDSLHEHVIVTDADNRTSFIVEMHVLCGRALLALRPLQNNDMNYLKGYKGGALTASGEALSKDTMWEFY
ncbi:fascin-like [Diadema setosum]|uniref:fascin-like n=1 Tax=Diadema setosum TaxID=31175 RepID=UPI003B3B3B70